MKRWTISSGMEDDKATFSARLSEVPWWVVVAEHVGEGITVITGHRLCCKIPNWMEKVPVGRPKRDSDGYLTNNVSWYVWSLGQRLASPFWKHEREILNLPITYEQAREVNAEFADDMNSLWDEDESAAS